MSSPRALVTGASGGIGGAVAARLGAAGWNVLRHRRPTQRAGTWLEADFAEAGAVEAWTAAVRERLGEERLGLLVHCAGIHARRVAMPAAEVTRMVTVNLVAPYLIAEGLVDVMAPESAMVLLSSIAAARSYPGDEIYGATKAGVEALTRSLAYRFGPAGVRVVAIAPGVVRTAMTRELTEDDAAVRMLSDANPSRRLAEPADIADLVAALASRDCRWVTGQIITADGGSLLGFGDAVHTDTGVAEGFVPPRPRERCAG